MIQLIAVLWGLLNQRRGPEDLPGWPVFVSFAASIYVAAALFIGLMLRPEAPFVIMLGEPLVTLSLWCMLIFSLLWVRGLTNRFNQTVSAVLLVDALLNLPLLLLAWVFWGDWIRFTREQQMDISPGLPIGLLVLLIWQLAVYGHIFTRSLELNRLLGIVIAMLSTVVVVLLSMELIGR